MWRRCVLVWPLTTNENNATNQSECEAEPVSQDWLNSVCDPLEVSAPHNHENINSRLERGCPAET